MFGAMEDAVVSAAPVAPSSTPALPQEVISSILRYLSLPESTSLPSPPLPFLREHIAILPPSLLAPFAGATTPIERASIPEIKARRMTWAAGGKENRFKLAAPPSRKAGGAKAKVEDSDGIAGDWRPADLTAQEGWRRWPLLWEKLGGDPVGPTPSTTTASVPPPQPAPAALFSSSSSAPPPPPAPAFTASSSRILNEHDWASSQFMPTRPHSATMAVNRLPNLLSAMEEEREWEDVRKEKRRERKLDTEEEEQGEEFEESDEEDEAKMDVDGRRGKSKAEMDSAADEAEVVKLFEKRLLELFLDGKDTIDYTPIDVPTTPLSPDPLVVQDIEDRYFGEQGSEVEDEADRRRPTKEESGLAEDEYDY